MTNNDREAFFATMALVAEVYGKPFSPERLALYWELLRHIELEPFQRAVRRHMANSDEGRFVPTPAHIRRAHGQDPEVIEQRYLARERLREEAQALLAPPDHHQFTGPRELPWVRAFPDLDPAEAKARYMERERDPHPANRARHVASIARDLVTVSRNGLGNAVMELPTEEEVP